MNDDNVAVSRAMLEHATMTLEALIAECAKHDGEYQHVTSARVLTDARCAVQNLLDVLTA